MDHRLKYLRTKAIKFLEENGGINLCDLDLGNGFLRYDVKSTNNKRERKQINWITSK